MVLTGSPPVRAGLGVGRGGGLVFTFGFLGGPGAPRADSVVDAVTGAASRLSVEDSFPRGSSGRAASIASLVRGRRCRSGNKGATVLPSNASPRGGVTGHRSWRARRGSLLRSRKGSVAEEGTLILPKRSPFARGLPRWVSAGAMTREVLQTSRTIEPVTRVPEASKRRARANRSKNARPPSLRRLDPRFDSSTQVEHGGASRRVRTVARWSSVRRRIERPTQPASVGAGE